MKFRENRSTDSDTDNLCDTGGTVITLEYFWPIRNDKNVSLDRVYSSAFDGKLSFEHGKLKAHQV